MTSHAVEKPYDWRDPEIQAHWTKVRADLDAGRAKDGHVYRQDNSSDHARFLANHHIGEAARWAAHADAIDHAALAQMEFHP